MQLNKAQEEAVEYLEGPLLVLAGPGTGKTQLLSQKVAYLLKNTDINPENILCMTFTESGATNMRERLKSIIGKDGTKVNINTYHSFGSDLLMQYRSYSDEYGRLLNQAIDEVTQFKIIKEIQDGLHGRDILRGDSVKDIISVISSAKSAGLNSGDLLLIAKTNIADSETLSSAISPLLQNVVPRVFKDSYENAYLPIYQILKNYISSDVIVSNIGRSIGKMAKDLDKAIQIAESEKKIKPLSSWKDNYFEKDSNGDYRMRDRIANKKLLSIANVMAQYENKLRDEGLFDFDDMIQEALHVLKNDAGFKATLMERYQVILLDEFQDTNPSQFAIIKELTDYEKPMIMAVGDDDQAIYEFQGALSTNLTDFKDHYRANVIALTENYRSTQEILDFSRKIINQATDRFADKELVSHKDFSGSTQIFRHEFLSSDMEYAFVADEIAKLIKKGVPQSEIAVISYKTKYFIPLLPYLKMYPEIMISYEKKDNLLEDEKIHELLTLARYVNELANGEKPQVSILEVLSYPFLELPIVEVIKLVSRARFNKKSIFDELASCDNPKIRDVTELFAELTRVAINEPLEIFFDYLLGTSSFNNVRSKFLDYYSSIDDYSTFSLYEKLASLRGKLKKHFGDKLLKLTDLIQMLDDYERADIALTMTSPYKESDDAISILSAHKAKGLEFSHVFIVSADHTAWGKGKGNNNLLSLPKNLTQIRHTGTTDSEKLRILYVAITRAKDSITITNSLHDFNDKSPERLEYLEEYEKDGRVFSPLIPSQTVDTHYEKSASVSSENNLKSWLSPYVIKSPDIRAIYKERVSKWRMSASSLTSFIDIVYAGPVSFFKSYILQSPREPETEALAFGDLVHKVFEKVTNEHISDERAVEYFLEELNKKSLSSDIVEKIRERGPEDLLVALNQFGSILRQGKAEVDFTPEKFSIEGVPVTGKIDHILIDESKKTIEIFDFKTGGYHRERWQSHATLYKYMLQLEFYKLLLNNSPRYRNYKIEKAHILFVAPDKNNDVYDKIYNYNTEDETEIIVLIKNVYKLVSSLEFLDDEDIFILPDTSLGIKDIKNFIDLLTNKYSN